MIDPGFAEEVPEKDEEEWAEETQVTKMLTDMKETVDEQVTCSKDLGAKADRLKRMARRPKSVRGLRAVSSQPPKPK